jgi:hypothetical protein
MRPAVWAATPRRLALATETRPDARGACEGGSSQHGGGGFPSATRLLALSADTRRSARPMRARRRTPDQKPVADA